MPGAVSSREIPIFLSTARRLDRALSLPLENAERDLVIRIPYHDVSLSPVTDLVQDSTGGTRFRLDTNFLESDLCKRVRVFFRSDA
jgi:hypothetical protein